MFVSFLLLLLFSHLSYSDEIVPMHWKPFFLSSVLNSGWRKLVVCDGRLWNDHNTLQESQLTNSNSSQLNNHIQNHSEQLSSWNADDSMLNELSINSNSSPHANNSHATTFEPHNDVTVMSPQRKEPYSPMLQGGHSSIVPDCQEIASYPGCHVRG